MNKSVEKVLSCVVVGLLIFAAVKVVGVVEADLHAEIAKKAKKAEAEAAEMPPREQWLPEGAENVKECGHGWAVFDWKTPDGVQRRFAYHVAETAIRRTVTGRPEWTVHESLTEIQR